MRLLPNAPALIVVVLFAAVLLLPELAQAGGRNEIFGCTLTQGNRKAKNCEGPNKPTNISWPPTSASDWCSSEDTVIVCGLTRLETMRMSVREYGEFAQLMHQVTTAVVTIAGGTSSTDQIDADIARGLVLAATDCTHYDLSPYRTEVLEIAGRVDEYNNGRAPGGPPHCDGEPCVSSEYTEWSACSAPCDGGIQTRSFSVNCPDYFGVITKNRTCSTEPCCAIGEWGAWSQCDGTCGDVGQRTRHRAVECHPDTTYPSPSTDDMELCPLDVPCCEWGSWDAWSSCSEACGETGGTRSRIRTEVCVPGSPHAPRTDDPQVESCNTNVPCCTSSVWGTWSSCSAVCNGGTRTRSRVVHCIDHEPKTEYDDGECGDCSCCTDPVLTPWSACSASCGGGTRSRYEVTSCLPGSGHPEETSALSEESCNPHTCCPANCQVCDTQTGVCTDCDQNHYLVQGVCVTCPDECSIA